jgi:hypothetical protein
MDADEIESDGTPAEFLIAYDWMPGMRGMPVLVEAPRLPSAFFA